MTSPFIHSIDSPSADPISTPYVLVSGWVAAGGHERASQFRLLWGDGEVALHAAPRPDVEQALTSAPAPEARRRRFRERPPEDRGTWSAIGFQGLLDLPQAATEPGATIKFELDGSSHEIPLTIRAESSGATSLRAMRAEKAARIRPLLRCVTCLGEELSFDDEHVHCDSCGCTYPAGRSMNFLSPTIREQFNVVPTERISAWGYDERSRDLIERYRDGLILDCGSGLRPEYLANVVNLEIVDYPTTDVLSVGQVLPFRDDSFDAVFSFAVLEHVTDPFACAAELVRVLKPRGTVFAVVPFMQPFHGYPDHYFNMTSSGLRQLFADAQVDVVEVAVPDPGRPIFALTWFLSSYWNGLDPASREAFGRMTVNELMGDPAAHLGSGIVRSLSARATEELAATNYIIATKRPSDAPTDR